MTWPDLISLASLKLSVTPTNKVSPVILEISLFFFQVEKLL